MQSLTLSAVLNAEDDGYVALCPELDIASQGNSIEQALANLKEASWGLFTSGLDRVDIIALSLVPIKDQTLTRPGGRASIRRACARRIVECCLRQTEMSDLPRRRCASENFHLPETRS